MSTKKGQRNKGYVGEKGNMASDLAHEQRRLPRNQLTLSSNGARKFL
jgi:hypothetical protein